MRGNEVVNLYFVGLIVRLCRYLLCCILPDANADELFLAPDLCRNRSQRLCYLPSFSRTGR